MTALKGDSSDSTPAVYGNNTNSAPGVGDGVIGESTKGEGVRGVSHNPDHGGVVGVSDQNGGTGVFGTCDDGKGGVVGKGVWGFDTSNGGGYGIYGESTKGEGMRGVSHNPNHGGVVGVSDQNSGTGVFGTCDDGKGGVVGKGVWGLDSSTGGGFAIYGESTNGEGVHGVSQQGEAVHGESHSLTTAGIAGFALNTNGTGAGVYGESKGKGPAGWFQGNVTVTGDIFVSGDVLLTNPQGQDCAEDFEVLGAEGIDPGSVVVIDSEGAIKRSDQAYDKRVAGVVSGAGDYKPGIVLGRERLEANRMPVALIGRVFCKVDAQYSPIDVGDLLTTSPTPGHAMKAEDQFKAFGAVIGKALRPAGRGKGLIPILVALQ